MIKLRYGNTNTFFFPGARGGLLVDTDWAGTLPRFFQAIKTAGLELGDISFVMATHYHPDHAGLIGELQKRGITLLLLEKQRPFVHFPDGIFERGRHLRYTPVDEARAKVISCGESRAFLRGLGIEGEIFPTPSHSEDSVSLSLQDGTCCVGDLEPLSYLAAYDQNPPLKKDWDAILRRQPKRILYAHADEQILP